MNTTYESQRKERLAEIIFDYLQDEDTSPEKLYTDIREEIIDALEYFEKYGDKCRRVGDLITDDFFPLIVTIKNIVTMIRSLKVETSIATIRIQKFHHRSY